MDGNSLQSLTLLFTEEASCNVGFASPTYSVLESSGSVKMDVLLHRKKRSNSVSVVPVTLENGQFDTQLIPGLVTVEYETKEGSAVHGKDFKATSGTLVSELILFVITLISLNCN